MHKVLSPFNSLFAKAILAVFWCVYVAMLAALIVNFHINILILTGSWTVFLPWITFAFLSGVQVEPGKRVGGGPMYPRVALEPGEEIRFNAPVYVWPSGGHLFVTNRRLIVLPIRFYGSVRTLRLNTITSVETSSKGFGWPLPKESVTIDVTGSSLTLRPSVGPRLAGLTGGRAFVAGVMKALGRQAPATSLTQDGQ